MKLAPSRTKRRNMSGNVFSQQIGAPNRASPTWKSVYSDPATKLSFGVVIHCGQRIFPLRGTYSLNGVRRILLYWPSTRPDGATRNSLFEYGRSPSLAGANLSPPAPPTRRYAPASRADRL